MRTNTLCLIILLFSYEIIAQVTEGQVFPIDSAIAHAFLIAPNVHSENIHSTSSGSVMTWDAANGRFGNKLIAWSFSHRVDQETADAINSVNGKEYRLFDLDSIPGISEYQIDVENWLMELGLPVSINNKYQVEYKIYPNPVKKTARMEARIPPGENYQLCIYDLKGKLIQEVIGTTGDAGLKIDLDFENYPGGAYIVILKTNQRIFSIKLIRE
jgi:hypothetical protein